MKRRGILDLLRRTRRNFSRAWAHSIAHVRISLPTPGLRNKRGLASK